MLNKLGDLSATIPLILALAVCVTGLGLAITFTVGGENQGIAFTQILALGGSALGGIMVPYNQLPKLAKELSHFTPQYWAQNGFQNILTNGAHLFDIWQNLAVLLSIGIISLIIALVRFNKFIAASTG